jgi:flagellar hook-associated protein 3 FlgL
MRISTGTMYDLGVAAINQQQAALLHTQQQISTGRRVATPADDPIAASQILETGQAQSVNQQYITNQQTAKNFLGQTDSVLGQVGTLLQDVRVLVINAGNPTLVNQDRAALATELQGQYQELLSLANSADGSGGFLFSGYQGNTQPFSQSGASVIYNGDEGQRLIQVSGSRQLPASDNGADIFQRVKTGNGVYATGAAAANAGGGVIDGGQVITPSLLTGHTYQISFNTPPSTYDVLDTTPPAATVSSANAYTSGNAISFAGMQMSIQGQPAAGDQFTVSPSTNQSVFSTLQQLITVLQTPVNTPANNAALGNGLNRALQNIDQALNKALTIRTAVGGRERELDAVTSASGDADTQYQARLSELQDTDYAKAISDLTRQKTALDAAQQTFVKVTGRSLFDFI